MMTAKIDMQKLGVSVVKWSKKFGDTNEETVVRLTTFLSRDLAKKMQPWGVSGKQRKLIEGAIAKDVRKSVRTVDNAYFDKLVSGEKRSVRFRGKWVNVTQDRLIKGYLSLSNHVDSLRSKSTGKVDKRKVNAGSVKITSERFLRAAIILRKEKAGLSKGLWLVAGRKAARLASSKAGLSVSTRGWPGNVAEYKSRLASASIKRGTFNPIVTIENRSPMTRMERYLKASDLKGSFFRAYRATISQYKRAVDRINKSTK